MPYFKTCYDTTAGVVFGDSQKLEKALKEALISTSLAHTNLGVDKINETEISFVLGNRGEEHIPAFIHPYLIQNFKGSPVLAVDVRLFRNIKADYVSGGEFQKAVRNQTEFGLWKARGILNLLWVAGGKDKLRAKFQFAGRVFASWLSQSIAKTYALDQGEQLRLTVLGIYYWHCLFTDEKTLTGNQLESAIIHIINATKITARDADALVSSIGPIENIGSYCAEAKKIIQNVRLNDFDVVMLLNMIKNSWYGSYAKEILSSALEHPPTWIAVVYTTLTERSYRGSSLSKIIEHAGQRGQSDTFKGEFVDMMLTNQTVRVSESVDDEPLVFKAFED